MKNLLTLLLLFTNLVLFSENGNATTYFFSSTDGDDSRTSTQAQSPTTPWKTISKLNSFFSSLLPGDFVMFKRGDTFFGEIIVNKSGTSGSPITLGAYGSGAKPIITGFTAIPSWSSIGNGIYETVISAAQSTLNMVTRDDAFQAIGRWPKVTATNRGYLAFQSHSGTTSITSNAIAGALNYVGGEVVIRANHYNLDRGTISAQTSSTITFTMLAGGLLNPILDNYGFFFQNHVNTLTSLGEWCYEASTKKLKMYFGGNSPSSFTIKASVNTNNVSISSKSYIIFDNLAFTGSNNRAFNITTSNNIQINNCDVSFAGGNAMLVNSACNHITVDHSTFSYINNNGIEANNSTYWTIRNNTFTNIGSIAGMGGTGDGQYYGTSYIGDYSLIEYNSLTNTGYHGFNFEGSSVTVQNNFVSNFAMIKDDGGGIYSYKNTATGVKTIKNNIVLNGIGAPDGTPTGVLGGGAVGIYLDGASYNVQVSNNTVANCQQAGILFNDAQNATVTANTVYNNGTLYNGGGVGGQIQFNHWSGSQGVRNVAMTNNIFFSKLAQHATALITTPDNDINQFFSTSDYNYYARPMDDNSTVFNRVSSPVWLTLTQWQSTTGKEAHSRKSPKTITTTNDLRFEYNASASSKVVNLGATYIDVTGASYSGTITLAPYSSAVLIYVSGNVANQSPVANAGSDKNFFLPTNTTTVTGSGTDADGTIASYQWSKVSGPSQFTIVSATQAQTAIDNLVQGAYQFELKVTDNSGASGKDTMTITVGPAPNQSPVANAGTDINITLPVNSVTLNGAGSDPDGTVSSYQWTKVSGPSQYTVLASTQAQTTVNNLVQGIYKFELRITDNAGATAKDTVQVTVNAAPINQSPGADAGLDINITLPVNSAILSGNGSDPDGTISSYQWTKISGPAQYTFTTPNQAQTTINNLLQGAYQFELMVTDNQGATAKDTVTVTVNAAPNQPPVANAGADIIITLPTNSVTLSGSGSDPDGTVSSYRWAKISGPSQYSIIASSQAQTTVNNLVLGVYLFELSVTDNSGATDRDTVQVTVNAAPPNLSPTANAGGDIDITLPINSGTLLGSGADPDGTIASYQWSKVSGPSQFTIVSSAQAQTTINNLVQGTYQFELKVTDNQGATDRDTVTITVSPAPNQLPIADAGLDVDITLPTNSLKLFGSGTDPDGTVSSYQWTKISGSIQYSIVSPTQAQTTVNNLVQGVYLFELKVTDNSGATDRDTVQVTVNAAPPNLAPTANAGGDIDITLPINSATLLGSGADPDGTIASYQWTRVSGPAQYNIASPNQAQTAVNNLTQGVYLFELTLTDNGGATARDTVQVTVNAQPINQPPSANAGLDINITLPVNSAILSGSGTDPDGTIASYQWTRISGPAQYSFTSANQAQTTVSNLVQGAYQFELVVTDNQGATAKDTVTVNVNVAPNQAPVANAGPDIIITLPTNNVTLSGSGSDPDGTVSSYRWAKISGPSQYSIVASSQAQTTVNSLVQGIYLFELRVTDNQGASARDTVQVTVNPAPPNQPPTADAGPDIVITLPTNSVILSGTGDDPDGTISSYGWTKISSPAQYSIISPSQPQTTVSNLAQGMYLFELAVTDNQGTVARDTVRVTVNPAPPNQPPTADAGADIIITLPTNSVTLSGSGTDPDGTISSYGWTKISGPSQYSIISPSQLQTTVNNLVQGIYLFEFSVTDNQGASARDTVQVTVNAVAPPPNQSPTANAGADIIITLPTNSVTLSGSGNDADGTISSYRWTKISGPNQYSILSSSQPQTTVNNLVQGVYLFELRVTDNQSTSARDTVQVTVNPAPPNQPPIANAGPDITIILPTNSATLSGSGSDVDGTISSYKWTKISGPSQFNILSSSQAQTAVNNLVQGIYLFQLRVTDNQGTSVTDTARVTVNAAPPPPNQSPTANAGADINITLPANSVTLTGSGIDPDGTIASYQWTKIFGPAQNTIISPGQAQTTVSGLVQGIYSFELKVTDNQGAAGKDTVTVTVNAAPAPNQAPVANAGPDINITLPTNSATLTGTGTDPDGTISSYKWTKISGPSQFNMTSSNQAQVTLSNLAQGIYLFAFTVTDNQGSSARDTVQVKVNSAPPNQLPTANAGSDVTITLPTNNVTLSGSGTDPDGSISAYRWTKISGPSQYSISSSTRSTATINNLVQGVYTIELRVTDNAGAIGRDTMQITVNPAAAPPLNQSPSANAGPDKKITLPSNSVTLSGTGTDPNGTIDAYQWTKISGPSQYAILSVTQSQTTVNNLAAGIYSFELKVTDNQGASGRDTVQVTVDAAAPPPNQSPTANAGVDIVITLPTNSVTVSGSGSDPDGTIAAYQWTKISGPAQYAIVSPTQALTTINNLVQGVYTFELKVTDNQGASGRDTVQVTADAAAPPPNQSPTANAGVDIVITLPTNSVTVSASGTDPDGTIAAYQWTKISGPAQYAIVSPTQALTTINNLVQGVYTFELKVTDNQSATGKDTVRITVNAAAPPPNQSPTANAGVDIVITLPTNSVTVSGSGTDPEGTIAAYQWTKISGPAQYSIVSPTQAQTTINNLVQGVYTFELKVTDNQSATGKDTVRITVNAAAPPPNQSPTANAGADINITLPTNSVTLSGSGTDPDGTIAAYQWTKISGPAQYAIVSPTQALTTINNLVQGVYTFELKVTDNQSATGKDTVRITVNAAAPPPNQSPTANAGVDFVITLPTNSVTVSGSGTDPDGTIAAYQWTKISGPAQYAIVSPTQAQTTINNLVQGVYTFELKVTDNQSATGKDTVRITVNAAAPPPNQSPTANAGADINLTLPVDSTMLNGSGTDADGTIVSYQWTKISGPSQYIIAATAKASTTIDNLVEGIYKFELKVTDNSGAVGKDTVQITVNAAPENQPPVANAGPDIDIALPATSVIVPGKGTDADGTVVSYQWTKISGPAQYVIASPTDAQMTVNDLVVGEYEFELKVTDNLGATGRDTVKITLNENLKSTAKIFPNPATSEINIQIHSVSKTDRTSIRIYDSKGLLVYQENFARAQQSMTKQVDISKLTNGVYYVEMNVDINKITTLMFVKQ